MKLTRAEMKIAKWFQATVSSLVLIALFTPFSATYLWLQIQKSLIKKKVKAELIAQIDKSELTQLTFSKSQIKTDLRWEHDREFEYKGEMYDVVEIQVLGDSICYLCWHDKAETKLNRHLQTLIAQATSSKPEHRAREMLCYQLLKLLAIEPLAQLHLIASESERMFVLSQSQYESAIPKRIKKPPRQMCFTPNPTT